MLRTLLTLITLGAAATSGIAMAEVRLKPSPTIESAVVTTGDIFEGTGVDPTQQLFRAPAPGQSLTLNRRQLQNLARYAKLDWSARLAPEKYLIQRASTAISADQIKQEIAHTLEQHGATGPLTLVLSKRIQTIHIGTEYNDVIAVDVLGYDTQTGKFSVVVQTALDSAFPKSWRLSGRAFTAMEVPVLSHVIRPGTPITMADIQWANIRVDRIPGGAVVDVNDILGMTLKRPVRPGTVLQNRHLQPPLLVKRGEAVTLEYIVGTLRLATTAIAMSHGAKNQLIQFRNPDSGRIIEAMMVKSGLAKTTSQAMKLAAR